tara:strand:+ start:214 stop:1389 length:1176 start_codon:yes stop_codon:yes gene_type:complete
LFFEIQSWDRCVVAWLRCVASKAVKMSSSKTVTLFSAANPPPSPTLVARLSDLPTKNEERVNDQPLKDDVELILQVTNDRFSLFPIKHPDLYAEYKRSSACFWTVEEIDLSTDVVDFKEKLNADERFFVLHVLAFFAQADGIVIENLVTNFCTEVQLAEARQFYTFQAAIEAVHSETYSLMIDALVQNEVMKKRLFSAIDTMPAIAKKAKWAMQWIASDRPFSERLVAFAVVEGVFFSGAFCAIFYLKKRGLMPGLAFANELISRDEGLHTDFATLLYRNHVIHKLGRERILEIITEAVDIECEFVSSALPVRLIGMNAKDMQNYIRFVADRLLTDLGYEKHYNLQNPFSWMQMISMSSKANFFEKRNSDYQKAGVATSSAEAKFDLEAAF